MFTIMSQLFQFVGLFSWSIQTENIVQHLTFHSQTVKYL